MDVARLAGKLSAETVNALANESSGPVGRLLGLPVDGEDVTVGKLKTDIANARGRVALLETGDWGDIGDGEVDLETQRFGAEPPQSMVNLSDHASREIIAACGLNSALWGAVDAASTHEAWRLALFSVLSPLGKKVAAELQVKLDDSLTMAWEDLRASDLSGRARAFQSMINGRMAVDRAAALAGLMEPE